MTNAAPTGYAATPPHPATAQRRSYSLPERIATLLLAAGGAIGVAIAAIWPVRSIDSGDPTCLLRITTGLPCPGCGMTRSWVHLAHGDVAGAFTYNLFGPLLFVLAAALPLWAIYALVRRRRPEAIFDRLNPRVVMAVVGVWLAYSVVRMVSLSMGYDTFAAVVS